MALAVCNILVDSDQKESLLAFLTDLPFTGFEESEEGWKAYLEQGQDLKIVDKRLEQVSQVLSFQYQWEEIQEENWNKVWEAHFSPILIEGFCWVRAPFHPERTDVAYQITIHPKMAFGTGHHATTYLMMVAMQGVSMEGKQVLDFGCGTGILAILAKKMGANYVEGIDISVDAYRNSLENASLNQTDLSLAQGGFEQAKLPTYDLILANITRNVIIAHLPTLYNRLAPEGEILFSGVLKQDEHLLLNELDSIGFSITNRTQQDKWICLQVRKG